MNPTYKQWWEQIINTRPSRYQMFPQEEERSKSDQWTREQSTGTHWKAGGSLKNSSQNLGRICLLQSWGSARGPWWHPPEPPSTSGSGIKIEPSRTKEKKEGESPDPRRGEGNRAELLRRGKLPCLWALHKKNRTGGSGKSKTTLQALVSLEMFRQTNFT